VTVHSTVGAAPGARESVSWTARAESDESVWVDVENDSDDDIEIASVVLSFYDPRGRLLLKSTIPCEQDCTVATDSAASFGPFSGPAGWATVVATKLHYESLPPESSPPGRPVASLAPLAPSPST